MTSPRFLCVHGHFYQPPRENPWLEDIEIQDSAHPFHNWNERIARECYGPNAASRVLDTEGRITQLINNYEHISFNFGPTLLSWMENHAPDIYRRIVEADRASVEARGGHGNALAQGYNHLILPLATRRDKETQVIWGIRDFTARFGRKPEGMWLPETAVDTETLNVLIEQGLRYTLLSPQQARRVRPARRTSDPSRDDASTAPWEEVSGGRIDPSRPYLWRSPAGGTIALYFYDAPISRAVAFEGLLNNGETFAHRLMDGFAPHRTEPQLVHVATDGESYGHHHRHGDMALAYALKKIQTEGLAQLTNYGEFLEKHPPTWEVEIFEASSWSCPHGVERWRSDCGCRMGGAHGHWNQQWRTPLREALNNLADALDHLYEGHGRKYFRNPWAARNAYIDVLMDRGEESRARFFAAQGPAPLSTEEQTEALCLLEMQRQRLLMFTSCAWFFDEISGLESTTVLLSAARALQLAARYPEGAELEKKFLHHLARAHSNIPEFGNGRKVYEHFVRPVVTDLPRLAAHLALRSAGRSESDAGRLYAFEYQFGDRRAEHSGGGGLSTGTLQVKSRVTQEQIHTAYAVLHMGGHDFHAVLKPLFPGEDQHAVFETLFERFQNGSLAEVLSLLGQHFGPRVFTLQDLLLEERRRMLSGIIEDLLRQFDETYRLLVQQNRKLLNYLQKVDYPMPHAFRLAIESVLGRDLAGAIHRLKEDQTGDPLRRVRREENRFRAQLDWSTATQYMEQRLKDLVLSLTPHPRPEPAARALDLLQLAADLELPLSLWDIENLYFSLWHQHLRPRLSDLPESQVYKDLAQRLRFAL